MEHERYCKICKRLLREQNPGTLCIVCQDNIAGEYDEKPYYNVKDLMRILGLDEEQVRRLGRDGKVPGRIQVIKEHRYLKEKVDRWLASNNLFSQ